MVFQINLACTPFQFFLHFTSESCIKIIDFFKENFPLHEYLSCADPEFLKGGVWEIIVFVSGSKAYFWWIFLEEFVIFFISVCGEKFKCKIVMIITIYMEEDNKKSH